MTKRGDRAVETKGKGVLIVDDSKAFREMVKAVLVRAGLFSRYYEARDGAEAITVLKSGDVVDLVLVDLFMPRMDGIDVLSWAREVKEHKDLPIVVLSVDDRGDVKARGLNMGASDYVVKPFDHGEFLARINLLLRRKEVQDELRKKNEELVKINGELKRLAATDSLTQLYNRSHFFYLLNNEMKRCVRYRMSMTLVMADLDNFKAVNDTFGHLAGDEVLREFAAILKSCVRDSDVVGRYGGEEFVMFLVHTDTDGAKTPAERIRASIGERVFTFPDGTLRITTSVGLAEFYFGAPVPMEELVRRADLALYEAKQAGKNMVVSYKG